MTMSTDYTETLKKIKETEEATSREILEKRKALEEELRRLEEASAASIAESKRKGEELVAGEVENARRAAQQGADAILASTSKEAKEIAAKKLDKAALRKIIDKTILPEFK
jgi:vacuolar-type H+-ATPase subunit H